MIILYTDYVFNIILIIFKLACLFPTLLNKAVSQKDPLERMKLVITTCLSSFYWTNTFLKPLNPILGETLEGYFNDGTKVYGE